MAKSRKKIGLALGSGAARGWAHIGVLRALTRVGLQPDLIAGCSIGALVGAAYAAGELDSLEQWVRGFTRLQVMSLLDPTFSGGLFRGDKVFGVAEERVGELTFAELQLPFACVATELETGREHWLQEGPVMGAVRASCSIPGMFVPVQLDGRWLIDGAVVNPVPVSLCRAMGADLVIAVNLNSDTRQNWSSHDDDEVAARHPLLQWLPKRNHAGAPSMLGVMNNSISIMQERITRARMAGDPPEIALNPHLGGVAIMDFHRASEAIAEGEACVERMIPFIEAEVHRFGIELIPQYANNPEI
jgi:NTE family protein